LFPELKRELSDTQYPPTNNKGATVVANCEETFSETDPVDPSYDMQPVRMVDLNWMISDPTPEFLWESNIFLILEFHIR
jgi:hypothetical protein